jgi:hypothetical protein
MSITSNLSEFASDFNSANDGIIIKTSSGIVSVPDNYYSTSSNLSADLLIIQGVNDSQNNIIGSAFSKANSAFDNSNTKFSSSGGTVTGDVTITGNVVVSGTTTTINVDTVTVKDKNIVLANVASPTDVTADGAGLTIKGTTDKTWNWVDSNDSWTSSENLNLLSGKTYKINGTDVLTGSALGSGVTSSSLTSVGTLSSLSVSGTTSLANVSYTGTLTGGTGILNIGSGQIYKDANGNVGIGTNAPEAKLDFGSIAPGIDTPINFILGFGANSSWPFNISAIHDANDTYHFLGFNARLTGGTKANPTFTSGYGGFVISGKSNAGLTFNGVAGGSGNPLVEFSRIDGNGNFLIGTNGVNNVYDQVAAARAMIIQSGSSATTLNSSTNALVICNSNTTTNNISQLSFAAITGASTNQYSSATISAIHGVRVNGQYPSGQLVFSTSSGTNLAPTEKMRIDAPGNLGLGVTPSAWQTGRVALQLQRASSSGGLCLHTAAGTQANIGANYYIDNVGAKYIVSAAASSFDQLGGAFTWYTAPSGTAGSAISFTQAMTLTAAGRLGVGQSSPTGLFVAGAYNPVSNAGITSIYNTTTNNNNLGNCFEWGHANDAGYRSVLGCQTGGGQPFVGFNCESGSTSNTFRTRGLPGVVISTDNNGALFFSGVTNSNADNQALVNRVSINNLGDLVVQSTRSNRYNSSSYSSGTVIYNTGIIGNGSSSQTGYSYGAVYDVYYTATGNLDGSSAYRGTYYGVITIGTGWSGSTVMYCILYTPLTATVPNSVGTLSVSVVFWDGSSETQTTTNQNSQIRIKVSGFGSNPSGNDCLYIVRRLVF